MNINKNIIAGWIARSIVLLMSFVNTRLIIDTVSAEEVAAYSIIFSSANWLALLNFGLPITIQNEISRIRCEEGAYHQIRDQAYGTMTFAAIAMVPIIAIIGWFFHKFLLVNYLFVSVWTVTVCFIFIYTTCASQLLTQVMYAEYDTFWPNIYPILSPIWIMCTLVIYKYYNFNNFNLLLLLVSVSNLLMPIHAAKRLKILQCMQFSAWKAIMQIVESKSQLLFATMSAATLSVDYLVMSRTLTAHEIVNYNLISRLFMSLLLMHGVLLATNWTPVSDLMHSSNKLLARKKVEQVVKQGLLIGSVIGLIILMNINSIIQLLGAGKVGEIPVWLSILFLIYVLLRIWTDTYAMALQANGQISFVNKFIPFQALLSVTGQYILGIQFGAVGIVLGVLLSFLFTASWIIPRKFHKIIGN